MLSSAQRAAVPPPRNYIEILSIILQNITEHLAQKPSKSSPNRSQNSAESMKKRPWNDGGAETRLFIFWGVGCKPWDPRGRFRGSVWVVKSSKRCKQCNQKLYYHRTPKNMKTYAERVPKGRQTRCQNTFKINAKIGIEQNHRNHQQLCFSDG